MKKVFLLPLLMCCLGNSLAQNSETLYTIKELIRIQFPQVETENKLIAINIWSPSDNESRACNQAFENTFNTFKDARLKGGQRGLILVLLVKENLDPTAFTLLKKDGVQCALVYSLSDAGNPSLFKYKNAVFASDGEVLYKNLYSDNIFSSVQSLITR